MNLQTLYPGDVWLSEWWATFAGEIRDVASGKMPLTDLSVTQDDLNWSTAVTATCACGAVSSVEIDDTAIFLGSAPRGFAVVLVSGLCIHRCHDQCRTGMWALP